MDSPLISSEQNLPGSGPAEMPGYGILFHQHPNPIFIFSTRNYRFLDINIAAVEKYGYSREEFLSMSVVEIRPDEDKEEFLQFTTQNTDGIRSGGMWRHRKKNDEIIFVDITSQAIAWKGEPARIVSVNDVTEHKRTEHRLLEAEKLYRHVIENAGDFIYTTDINGYFREVNESALKVSGYTVEELQQYRYLDLIAPDYRKKIMLQYTKQFLKREKSLHVEFPFVIKDGSIKWFGQYSTLIYKDDKPVGFHVIGYDITSRKIAEEELNKANVALEKRVQDRTHDLAQAMERLQEALEREKELSELKSRFVRMISHEFRTPLTSILSYTEILQRYSRQLDNEKREKMYKGIVESVHRMTYLLENILEFGKSNPFISFQPDLNDPVSLFKEIIDQTQDIHTERNINFSVAGIQEKVTFDRKLLRQIITNLISNALKFSPKNSPIDIFLLVEENRLYFTIADQGKGMNQEELKHLFEPFYRGDSVETIAGTGLGLSIVKRSIERHGGSISIQSEIGHGTCITVEIPLP